MKKELDTSKASFKLDLIETANADPMVTPADLKVLAAFVSVMEWPSCKAWLASTLGRAKTGLSDRQFWESRARLLGKNEEGRAYLVTPRKNAKVSTFILINPYRDEAIERISAMTDHFKEVERQKKVARRAKLSPNSVQGQNGAVPADSSGLSLQNLQVSTPYEYPKEKEESREDVSRSNIVPFNSIPRKSA